MNRADTLEKELRDRWTAHGVTKERQDAILLEVSSKAQVSAKVGPWMIGATAEQLAVEREQFRRNQAISEQRDAAIERRHRRLVAQVLDTTGDLFDQMTTENPLFAVPTPKATLLQAGAS